jgi:hypothetical protein
MEVPEVVNSATYTLRRFWLGEAAGAIAVPAVRPFQALLCAPSLLFLGTLTVMLFRPPDVQCCAIDRYAFLLLVFIVVIRALLLHQSLRVFSAVTWPMLGLALLAIYGALTQPYDAQTWSLVAAKFIVPYTLFHLSILVFADSRAGRHFEIFAIVALAYLSFTAIAFLLDAKMLIFPRYILDESLGIHADRARGPFLQAVANGVTLNMLGLIALDLFRRGCIRGVWALALLVALPVAILATMTRAVWLSFAVSVMLLLFRSSSWRVRRACLCLVVAGGNGANGCAQLLRLSQHVARPRARAGPGGNTVGGLPGRLADVPGTPAIRVGCEPDAR